MKNYIENLDFENIFNEVFSLKKYTKKQGKKCSNFEGIYFLWDNDIITYIGISQSISQRLFYSRDPHIKNKIFTHYSFVEIKKENRELEKLESILINFFDPIDNSTCKGQLFVDKLPKYYYNKIKTHEKNLSYENAKKMMYYFNLI